MDWIFSDQMRTETQKPDFRSVLDLTISPFKEWMKLQTSEDQRLHMLHVHSMCFWLFLFLICFYISVMCFLWVVFLLQKKPDCFCYKMCHQLNSIKNLRAEGRPGRNTLRRLRVTRARSLRGKATPRQCWIIHVKGARGKPGLRVWSLRRGRRIRGERCSGYSWHQGAICWSAGQLTRRWFHLAPRGYPGSEWRHVSAKGLSVPLQMDPDFL